MITGADAVHPGFGFLSENSKFARICEKCGITFIGPSPESIDMLGDKANAKKTMEDAGVPVIPGSKGEIKTLDEARELAEKIGYHAAKLLHQENDILAKDQENGGQRAHMEQHVKKHSEVCLDMEQFLKDSQMSG